MKRAGFLQKMLVISLFLAGVAVFIAYRTGYLEHSASKKERIAYGQPTDTLKKQKDTLAPYHPEYKEPEVDEQLILMSTKSIMIHKIRLDTSEFPNDPKKQKSGLLKPE